MHHPSRVSSHLHLSVSGRVGMEWGVLSADVVGVGTRVAAGPSGSVCKYISQVLLGEKKSNEMK